MASSALPSLTKRLMLETFNIWIRKIKLDIIAIYLASRDARTPRAAKFLAIAVAAYAFSPIDLIPDFIPVLGYLDDLILIPAGIALVVKLIPVPLMATFRHAATNSLHPGKNWIMGCVVVWLWAIFAILFGIWVYRL